MQEDKEEGKGASGGGLLGGRSKAAADAPTGPQKQKKISAKLVDAKPVGKEVQACFGPRISVMSVKAVVNSNT